LFATAACSGWNYFENSDTIRARVGERMRSGRRSPTFTRRHVVLAAAVAAGVTAVAVAELAGGSGSAGSAAKRSFTVATKDRVIHLTQRQAHRLSGAPTSGPLSLLAVREGRAFYRLGDARARCYAVGDARSLGTPGAIACWDGSEPLMDLSVVDLSSGSRSEARFFRIEGIAADEVSSVGVVGANGAIVARVPVVRNVYAMAAPPQASGRGLVALDRRGSPLTSLPGP
jgi:hypothetical protein